MTPRTFLPVAALLALTLPLAAQQPGSLDHSFSGDGRVTTAITEEIDEAYGVMTQSDGKIVVVGVADRAFGLVRYLPNGALDMGFGSNGVVRTTIGPVQDGAYAMDLQADGKIIAVGYTKTDIASFSGLPVVARYLSNGTLDPTFGTGGKVTLNIDVEDDSGFGTAVQPDGKIVVACTRVSPTNDFLVFRLTSNGTLDNTFGTGGIAATLMGSGESIVYDMALQTNGRILVVGSATGSGGSDLALTRFTSTGTLDNSFGIGGKVLAQLESGADEFGYDVAVQPDGKILAVTTAYYDNGASSKWGLLRFLANGTPDVSFGGDGKIVIDDTGTAFAEAVTVQSDGRILIAGYGPTASENFYCFTVARFDDNGLRDYTFGDNGFVRIDFQNLYSSATDIAVQPDGNILIVGTAFYQQGSEFAAARLASGTEVAVRIPRSIDTPKFTAYPNPVSGDRVMVHYELTERQRISIRLVDAQGKLMYVMAKGRRGVGVHEEPLNLRSSVPNGAYFIQLITPDGVQSTVVTVVR